MAKPIYQHMKNQREAANKARQQDKLARKQTRASEPGEVPATDAPDAAAAETPVAPKP